MKQKRFSPVQIIKLFTESHTKHSITGEKSIVACQLAMIES